MFTALIVNQTISISLMIVYGIYGFYELFQCVSPSLARHGSAARFNKFQIYRNIWGLLHVFDLIDSNIYVAMNAYHFQLI